MKQDVFTKWTESMPVAHQRLEMINALNALSVAVEDSLNTIVQKFRANDSVQEMNGFHNVMFSYAYDAKKDVAPNVQNLFPLNDGVFKCSGSISLDMRTQKLEVRMFTPGLMVEVKGSFTPEGVRRLIKRVQNFDGNRNIATIETNKAIEEVRNAERLIDMFHGFNHNAAGVHSPHVWFHTRGYNVEFQIAGTFERFTMENGTPERLTAFVQNEQRRKREREEELKG